MKTFDERVYNRYSKLMRTHVVSYRNRLNAPLANVQLRDKCVEGYFIGVGEDGYSPLPQPVTREQGQADIRSLQREGDDIIKVIVPSIISCPVHSRLFTAFPFFTSPLSLSLLLFPLFSFEKRLLKLLLHIVLIYCCFA